MNENESWLLDDNIESFSADPAATKALKADPGFVASNKMDSINGFIYGNLPGLDMCQGDKVRWHMIGLGTWSDVHNRKYSQTLEDLERNHVYANGKRQELNFCRLPFVE